MEIKIVPGMKHDEGKMPWHVVLQPVQAVLDYGDKKYEPGNWRKVPGARWRYIDAAIRHLLQWLNGNRIDPESGLTHLAHAVVSIMFLIIMEDEGTV